MRIGINLIPLRPGRMGGAEVYFRDLLGELLRRGGHEYLLVTADYNHDTLPELPACRRLLFVRENAGTSRIIRKARRILEPMVRRLGQVRHKYHRARAESLRSMIRRERLDLWFCPFTKLDPVVRDCPGVITVYDLQHEYAPQFFSEGELRDRRGFYPESCRSADHIIAISEFTRRCIGERYDVPPDRVSAVWLAPGSNFEWRGAEGRVLAVRAKYRLPSKYAFYPANTWHHKNHGRLVEALAIYRRSYDGDLGLVLTGVGENGHRALQEAITSHALEHVVHVLGHVPYADLPALYAGATCLVHPSLFEGFGIPLVEAMLAGCPIVAARATSIPEVVGDAAILFDPLSPAAIAQSIAAVARDPERAADLVRRGRARATMFSVSEMADRTLEIFERVSREWPSAPRPEPLIDVEGVYPDSWMGPSMLLSLRGTGLDAVEVEGDLPALAPIVPQELAIRVDGRAAATISLEKPGPFAFSVPLMRANGPVLTEVSLSSQRTFCPAKLGVSEDDREVSIRILAVRARTSDGRRVVKTFGTE